MDWIAATLLPPSAARAAASISCAVGCAIDGNAMAAQSKTAFILLDLEGVLFLGLRCHIDLSHVGVRHLLDLIEGALLIVLGDFLILEQLLHRLIAIAADVAHRDAMVLGDAVKLLDQIF